MLTHDPSGVKVVRSLKLDGPAALSGVLIGDTIVSIDEVDIKNETLEYSADLCRGVSRARVWSLCRTGFRVCRFFFDSRCQGDGQWMRGFVGEGVV